MKYHAAWGSHIYILTKILMNTKGDVLELGMGPFSTPIMHWICRESNRRLLSIDNDPKYFDMNRTFDYGEHRVQLVDDWDKADIDGKRWSVALVDHKPAERRVEEIKRLRNSTDYVIVHDTQNQTEHEYNYNSIYGLFKYRYNYRREKPYTTVLSNFDDLKWL